MELNKSVQFTIWLVNLDPTIGSEIKKTRPAIIISPNEINSLKTVIIAPLTSKSFPAPTRIQYKSDRIEGLILLDQIRAVDKRRLVKYLGKIHYSFQRKISAVLLEMFALER